MGPERWRAHPPPRLGPWVPRALGAAELSVNVSSGRRRGEMCFQREATAGRGPTAMPGSSFQQLRKHRRQQRGGLVNAQGGTIG